MAGKVEIRHWFIDEDTSGDEPTVYTKVMRYQCIQRISQRKTFYYGSTDTWLYEALDDFPIKGMKVVVMGSKLPWYESICLHYGGTCSVIEYAPLLSEIEGVDTMTPHEYEINPIVFDAGFSISSFEHDGLGRYGDPIDPDGDLKAMTKMKRIIKHGGLLFLAVPLGIDTVVWNAHRIYGQERLPLLLEGWEVVGKYGYDQNLLQRDVGLGWDPTNTEYPQYQPIFVLKNL